MYEKNPCEVTIAMGQGPDVGDLLSDPHHTRADCRLAARAVRERWPVPDAAKTVVVERLLKIIDKREVEVICRNGQTVTVDGPADSNAIAAARVLVAMTGQVQSDEHFAIKMESDVKTNLGDTINIACVGSIALGQEPLSPQDAKRQAQEVLARVKARTGHGSLSAAENTIINAPSHPTGASTPRSELDAL